MFTNISLSGVIILSFIVLLVLMPFALLWSLNTLFPILAIPYTLETWFASFLMCGILTASKGK